MVELPQIVDAVAMIGMVVGPDHRVDVGDVGVEQLVAQVGPGVDEDPRLLRVDQDRDAAAGVPRLGGIALAPVVADPRDARGRAAAEDRTFIRRPCEQGAEICGRRSARASTGTPRRSARKRAVSATKAGSHGLPRCGTGARNGESVSISSRSAGSAGRLLQVLGILEGHDPGNRDVEAEIQSLVGEIGAGGEAVDHAGKAPFPISSARIAAVSSSASRVWTMIGRPVSRAAAIWARKLARCRSRSLWS